MDQSCQRKDNAQSDHWQLDGADVPAGQNLSDEQVVHVGQWEESQAQEEQSLSFFAVGEVVVPQHQHGQSRQNHYAQQEVNGSDV